MLAAFRLFAVLTFTLLFLVGCGGSKKAPAKVSGKVTYKGAPVTGGNINFHSKGSGVYSYNLTMEGTYTGLDLPAEEMVVTVLTESLNPNLKKQEYTGSGRGPRGSAQKMSPMPQGGPASTGPSGVYVKIPAKYAKKETSTLTATLTAGSQTKDFDLAD
jgi:hypothetical protein